MKMEKRLSATKKIGQKIANANNLMAIVRFINGIIQRSFPVLDFSPTNIGKWTNATDFIKGELLFMDSKMLITKKRNLYGNNF